MLAFSIIIGYSMCGIFFRLRTPAFDQVGYKRLAIAFVLLNIFTIATVTNITKHSPFSPIARYVAVCQSLFEMCAACGGKEEREARAQPWTQSGDCIPCTPAFI